MTGLPLAGAPEQSATRVAALRVAKPSGWWGMAMLVATEGTLFATLVASYFYLRFRADEWPPAGTPHPGVWVPIVLAAILVATSVPMQAALVAVRRGRLQVGRMLLLAAFLAQAGYLGVQIARFDHSLDRFPPQQNAYASIYYTLLGAHHAHVLAGLALDLWLLAKLSRGLTNYRLVALQSAVLYWHFVNVLAVAVTATLLSAA